MHSIVAIIQNKPDFYALHGATDSEIEKAEEILGTQFTEEYRNYVSSFGVASFAGHEFTGVCKPKRLNVVDVTIEHRRLNPSLPEDWYVIEETHIDGITIWQSPKREIFQVVSENDIKKINNTLEEFISGL